MQNWYIHANNENFKPFSLSNQGSNQPLLALCGELLGRVLQERWLCHGVGK